MIRFTAGAALIIFALLLAVYRHYDLTAQIENASATLQEAIDKQDQGRNLSQRIKATQKISLINDSISNNNLERILEIGPPRLSFRTVGQPLVRGTKALYRYDFRINGVGSYTDLQNVLDRMNTSPGFVVKRVCFACSVAPRDVPPDLRTILIEGFLYAYDRTTFY